MSLVFFKRLITAFSRGFTFSEIHKLNWQEISFLILTLALPLFLFKLDPFYFFMYEGIIISLVLTIRDVKKDCIKEWGNLYKPLFFMALIVQFMAVLLIILGARTIVIVISIILILGLILLISIGVGSVFYIINLGFYIILKYIFPNEDLDAIHEKRLKLKELSSYMSIQEQIAYLILMMIHLSIYIVIVLYVFGFLATKGYMDDKYIMLFAEWANSHQMISFGNGLGLASIIIAICTVTISAQMRLEKAAYEKYNNRNLDL